MEGNLSVYCWHVARFATPIHSLSSLVESHVLPCTCKYVRARVPGSRFFSSHPLARDPPREGTFSNRWWPTAAQFFFLFLASSTPSTLFFFFLHSLSLSLSLFYRCTHYPPFRFRIGVLFIHRRPEWPLAPSFFT